MVIAHVDDLEGRGLRPVDPAWQVDVQRHAGEALHARGRGSEDHDRAAGPRPPAGHGARIVGRLVLLLVGDVVLLVDDDEPQADERSEHGRARADDDARLAAGDLTIGQKPLAGRKPGVQDSDALACRSALAHGSPSAL